MKKLLIGLVALGLIFWWLAERVDLSAAWTAFAEANWYLLAAAVLLEILNICAKGTRWALALEGALGTRPKKRVYRATMMGFAGNFVLPARLGELLRAAILHRHNPEVGYTRSLASAGLTQFLDLIFLLFILAGFSLAGVGSSLVDPRAALGFLAIALGALSAVVVFSWRWDWVEAILDRFGGEEHPLVAKISGIVRSIHDATQVLRNRRFFAPITGFTVLTWAMEFCVEWLAMLAFGIEPTLTLVGLTMVGLSLSFAIPVTPGNAGVHQVVSVLVLGLFGVEEARALAFSIGLQASITLSVVALGALFLAMEGMSLDTLRHELEAEQEALAHSE